MSCRDTVWRGDLNTPATATCRTSEITVDEFLSLKGKMDARDPTDVG